MALYASAAPCPHLTHTQSNLLALLFVCVVLASAVLCSVLAPLPLCTLPCVIPRVCACVRVCAPVAFPLRCITPQRTFSSSSSACLHSRAV